MPRWLIHRYIHVPREANEIQWQDFCTNYWEKSALFLLRMLKRLLLLSVFTITRGQYTWEGRHHKKTRKKSKTRLHIPDAIIWAVVGLGWEGGSDQPTPVRWSYSASGLPAPVDSLFPAFLAILWAPDTIFGLSRTESVSVLQPRTLASPMGKQLYDLTGGKACLERWIWLRSNLKIVIK